MWKKIRLPGILLLSVCLCLVLVLTFLPGSSSAPSFEQVHAAHSRSESVLLDRHGEIIHELRTDKSGRRLDWVPLKSVSPALFATILFSEDRHFYRHHGVNWASLARAAASFFGSGSRGASTITMQLAAQLDQELRPSSQHRTLRQKWLQIRSAWALERRWSKEQIFEAYLNLVTFRGELQGLPAATGGLFGKQSHGLTDVESAILAALVRSPNASVDQVARRACALAAAMKLGLNPAEISSRANDALSHPYFIRPQAALAPQAAQRLFREAREHATGVPERIVCTLDRGLQQFAFETLRRHLMTVRAQNVRDGAVLVADNRTGEILAYVANSGDQGSARYVDGIQGLRQAGSTLKPFLYGAAFDRRLLTAASLLDDSPLDVPVAGGMYRPSNYDKLFHGPVTARIALASSLNVPAVRTLNLIGVEAGLKVLRTAGFEKLRSDDFYGASLALGAADVTLWELVSAYRSLATHGEWNPLRLRPDETAGPGRRVMTPEAAFIVASILSDRESRSQTFSLESPLSTRFWTAVKTGTSKDMRDNWCIGFSDRTTVGVWTGNFSGEPMWNVSGITGAAPVWVEIMNWLHHDRTSSEPQPPSGVTSTPSSATSRREWFIRGTEMAVVAGEPNAGFRIKYPAQGTVIAIDPDIPAEEQKLFFEAQPKSDRLRWVLDGRAIGNAGALLLWTPVRGKHALALVDDSDHIVDSIAFEVRGGISPGGHPDFSPAYRDSASKRMAEKRSVPSFSRDCTMMGHSDFPQRDVAQRNPEGKSGRPPAGDMAQLVPEGKSAYPRGTAMIYERIEVVRAELRERADPAKAENLQWFFKTGAGEYGEGDRFLGVRVPVLRGVAKKHRDLSLDEIRELLSSTFHEERLLALFLLVHQYDKGDKTTRAQIYRLYLKSTRYINNWDLVDSSAQQIVGRHLISQSRGQLFRLARSGSLWERRIAIMSTFHFVRHVDFHDTFEIADMLLKDREDLIHKAVGWMIREVANRDMEAAESFLMPRYHKMPRTMLRYAIEKFPAKKRLRYLLGKV